MIKIEYNSGCCSMGTFVNDTNFNSLTLAKRKEIIHKLIETIDDEATLQDVTNLILSYNGDFEDRGYCEQCGDFCSSQQMNIDVDFDSEQDIVAEY